MATSSLGVITYLFETKKCELGARIGSAWTTAHLANEAAVCNPPRLDILQWLFESNLFDFKKYQLDYSAPCQWEGYTFSEYLLNKERWQVLKWLFDTNRLDISPGTWLRTVPFTCYKFCPQVIKFLADFYDGFTDEDREYLFEKYPYFTFRHPELDELTDPLIFELLKKSITAACDARKFTVFESLKKRLIKTEETILIRERKMYSGENIALDFCMQELLKVDVDRALQFGFSALKDACFNKKSRNSLQMRIADAIFARNIFMPDEADCILQAFFSSDEIHLRCALQAFYFLQEVSDTSKLLLMELIHERLSGRILLDDETASVETWLPKVAACYSLYVLFKEKNKDPIFTALCQRLANEYTRSQQAGAFSPNWATLFQPTETENVILDAKVARNKV